MDQLAFISSDNGLPIVITPSQIGQDLINWAANNREYLHGLLNIHGAILFRGFKFNGSRHFENFMTSASGVDLLEYSNRSTPRTLVQGKVYTSTEYPASEIIPLHNENSYSHTWAMKIFFFCVKASEQGGETPIADSRKVYLRISPEIREKFIRKKVMYVRNYGHLDLPWKDVFQTSDKTEVENFCRASGIELEWKSNGDLRTRQVCQAVATHPVTGELVWFNQAHLFHISGLNSDVRKSLLETINEEDFPRNAYYGDGTPIEDEVLNAIREAYDKEEIKFLWKSGDVLLLDNMLFAHGRKSYTGSRKVLVGMA
jgi:alpha-ketoglutarate-dependent taurine dioxygenase